MAPQPRTSYVPFILAHLAVLAVFWYIFVGTVSTSEVEVGLPCIMLTILVAVRLRILKLGAFHPRPVWLLQGLQLPVQVLHESLIATLVLWRRLAHGGRDFGTFATATFQRGDTRGEPAPRETARRALAVTYTSLPPNTYVVDIDDEAELVLYNELSPQGEVPSAIKSMEAP